LGELVAAGNRKDESTITTDAATTKWAEDQAASLLSPLGERWLHTKSVVERARQVGRAFNEKDRALLIAAAYMHDVGYAPALSKTGFHPLDGANYLLQQGQTRLASLVAHHSEAQYEAELRGLSNDLSKFPREQSTLTNALTYCDMTTGTTGLQVSFEARLADIFQRFDKTHIVNQAIHEAKPRLAEAIKKTEEKLHSHRSISKKIKDNT